MKTVTNRAAGKCITDREEFTNSGKSFRGVKTDGSPRRPTGRLSSDDGEALYRADADYVVYSYATPIAWHGKDGWTVPETRYSTTTGKHQHIVRRAIYYPM